MSCSQLSLILLQGMHLSTTRPSTRYITLPRAICCASTTLFLYLLFLIKWQISPKSEEKALLRHEQDIFTFESFPSEPSNSLTSQKEQKEQKETISCVMLHKTHRISDSILQRMEMAKKQFTSYSFQSIHLNCKYTILYWIDMPGEYTDTQKKDIQLLREMFGENTVYIVDYQGTNLTFPGLYTMSRGVKWLKMSSNDRLERFAWNMAG